MSAELMKKLINRFGSENVMTFIIDNARRITFNKDEYDEALKSGDLEMDFDNECIIKHEVLNGLKTCICVPFEHVQTVVFYD